jgi:hypothetical protein
VVLPSIRAAAFAFLALAAGCRGDSSRAGAIDPAAVGPRGNVDDVDFAPYLAFAHAIVTHAPAPDGHPPPRAGQRVFVTFWSPGQGPVRTTGLGATLLDSIIGASQEAAKTAVGGGRIEIDVLTSADVDQVSPAMRDATASIGTHGYLASDARGRVGFVLPNEIVADALVAYDAPERAGTLALAGDKIGTRLAARAGVTPAHVESMSVARFGVSAHVEGAFPGEAPLLLYRSIPPQRATVSPDQLLDSVRLAADYLARMVGDDGRFVYSYDPVVGASADGGEYSMLRHAGAIIALMEAYEELRVPAWAEAAERAIRYLLPRLIVTEDGTFLQENEYVEQQKVGGSGLALIALAKYQVATGSTRNLPVMRALAKLIARQQYPDGHFRDNADVAREVASERGKKRPEEAFFFVGEATLGLLRLYAIDPNPAWLAAARKAADWVIDVRDANDDLKRLRPDHWMSYALHDLVVLTGERRYADHAFQIGRAIALAETSPPLAPDYVGAFTAQGDSSPSATGLEAVTSQLEIARWLGDSEDEAWLLPLATRLACFTRSQQLDAESAYFAKDPPRAIGGVRESRLKDVLRIDYAQHAASGWLRLARELRDPSWGTKAQK